MRFSILAFMACLILPFFQMAAAQRDGSAEKPLRVLLIPADGGTEDGTKADFKPLFDAMSQSTGLHFEVHTGQSYAAVIKAMCAGLAEVAWFGPMSYLEARERGCAELLAMEARDGSTTYYAGLFVAAGSDIETVADLAGHDIALGSPHSASSFAYPLAMISAAGLDPLADLGAIRLTGSHASSLMALRSGQVDAAGASFVSFERAVNQGSLDPAGFRVLAKSEPIPNPPLAMHPGLSPELKATLREAIASVHEAPGINPEAIRGYGGKRVDRYIAGIDGSSLDRAADAIAFIDDDFRAALLQKAGMQTD
ncbi:phosphate/phosphite/phosphonate ABC transporter substrate-binding protein [Henriciella aquimarina]|uniref:phosphate/phosphite/phosphonate ABC transporter substrate-binding protein n=1 Tax=Henriciella aquimarina TaxID=545261 RepID=UPI0009FDC40F|nr:phosphate/phosphite/phosphonate ABC transporter substrate-binding protein [Henriciella aquimarina]